MVFQASKEREPSLSSHTELTPSKNCRWFAGHQGGPVTTTQCGKHWCYCHLKRKELPASKTKDPRGQYGLDHARCANSADPSPVATAARHSHLYIFREGRPSYHHPRRPESTQPHFLTTSDILTH